jgi:hypothetical protein
VTVFVSAPERIPAAYARYLRTRFGEAFGLVGVPLRLRFRARRDLAALDASRGSAGRRRPSSRRSAGARARPR